jgi:quercetin dioxygenase-like cupin family protein
MGDALTIRRVVTGHDASGRAVVLKDSVIQGREVLAGQASFAVIWKTISSPVDNDDAADRAAEPVGLTQPNGSVLRIVDIPPGVRSPMHRTNSLDYGLVLSGEVSLELDDGAMTDLRPGDVVVQRGTIHAWINRGKGSARMAFVLLDANAATHEGRRLEPVAHDIRPE